MPDNIITRDGIRLVYDEAGKGGPPMLFVHGFGGDARHFDAQLEHFGRRHRVVALDRRGHGRSDKPEGPYTIAAIAEEVGWTARELGLHRPVLVAHSMGAIGIELAAQSPDLLSALVLLDTPLFPPLAVEQTFRGVLDGLRTEGYRQVIGNLCDRLIFLPTDDRARRARLHEAMLRTPQRVMASTWEGFCAYDPAAALARCRLPVLLVAGVMPFDEGKVRQLCPQVVVGRTVGAGHFHQLEVADQVNAMIERFLTVSAPDQGRSTS
jgi:pimeloyl-ACP methyl ester carboxylesterase